MRQIQHISIHVSGTPWGCGLTVGGFHFVILNGLPDFADMLHAHRLPTLDGSIENTRYLDQPLDGQIKVCLIGVHEFTARQRFSLIQLLDDLTLMYRIAVGRIIGGWQVGTDPPPLDLHQVHSDLIAWRDLSVKTEIKGGVQ